MQLLLPFFYRFGRNVKTIFSLRNLPWHALAILLTLFIVKSGFDQYFFVHTRLTLLFALFIPAALLGFIVPVVSPFAFIILGKHHDNKKAENLGFALGQSVMLGWLLSSGYKAFTGRLHPDLFAQSGQTIVDISRQFHFGLLREGIFWGWPSSHTTVAFAFALTAIVLHSSSRVKFFAGLFALYVGIGVATTGIHWFSDFAAGAILGTLVGIVVGLTYGTRSSNT